MGADQTPLDVEAIRAELAAMAGRPWTAEAAEYFIGRLLDENARLNAENTGLVEQVVSLKSAAAEHVLVEGSWFKREDLPTVLGNFMRSSAENAREAKALSARLTAKNAELDKVIREAATNKAKLAAVEKAVRDSYPWECDSPTHNRICHLRALTPVNIALGGSEMPRPPAEEAQERPETAATGSGRGTGVTEAQNSQQAFGEEA